MREFPKLPYLGHPGSASLHCPGSRPSMVVHHQATSHKSCKACGVAESPAAIPLRYMADTCIPIHALKDICEPCRWNYVSIVDHHTVAGFD